MQHAACFAGGQINIVAADIGPHKRKAVGMSDHATWQEFHFARDAETLIARLQQLAIAHHRTDATEHHLQDLLITHRQLRRERFQGAGCGRIFECRENRLATWDG